MTEEHVRQVKQRHEHELLGLDGVQGVGIGDDHGHPAIMVYVDDSSSSAQLRKIPRRINDVHVVVEESGAFRAYY
jgi:hypothetical protein